MSALSSERPRVTLGGGRLSRPGRERLVPLVLAIVAVGLALSCKAFHPNALPRVVLIGVGALVLFGVCGDALAVALTPADWREVRPFLALPFGAAAAGIVLMAFGVAHVPLHFSLWITLAIGLGASFWVRRRAPKRDGVGAPTFAFTQAGRTSEHQRGRAIWALVLAILFLVALLPAWRTGALTVYGQNPDSSQVVGIAVLFQHVPPTHTDVALPLDVVPQEWRFRYPIFYPLAALANLVHADPIQAFPIIQALLLVVAALGFGLLAVRCFGAPAWAGPVITALLGFTWILQYLAWHPYWNQLWGTALLPYTLLFGWHAISGPGAQLSGPHRPQSPLRKWDGRAAIACVVMLLMLWFAYPLALPYPLAILAGVLVAYWRRPRRPQISGWRGWVAVVVILCLLLPAVVGSVLKLKEAIVQLLTPNSSLWGGDVKHFISFGRFAGTDGGVVAAVLVVLAAAYGLSRLPGGRRVRICFGVVMAALLLLDLRFRLAASGTYMDFKHLSFVGLIVLTLAASGLLARTGEAGVGGSGHTLRWAAGLVVVIWCGAALVVDHRDAVGQNEQVTPQLLQIRQWADALPAGSSVRVDIPPNDGGLQLWAVYMLGSHPVDSYEPVLNTTYAHAIAGFRADYSLSLSVYPSIDPNAGAPFPQPKFTASPPLFTNAAFVVRKIDWPASADSVAQTASQQLVEP